MSGSVPSNKKKKRVPRSTLQNSAPSQNSENYGFPIQLINVAPDGKLLWNKDAVKYLASYERIAIVSIVGRARAGKSLISCKLLDLPPHHGFQVGSTNRPITIGIWVWSKPLSINGINVFFCDSEGACSLHASDAHDKRIQMLIWNLSSMILFNSVGLIDEASISDLSLICLVSKMLGDAVQGEEKTIFAKDTPSFIWILRDGGSLQLVDPETKQSIDAPEYLEQSLRPRAYLSNKKRKGVSQEESENAPSPHDGDGNKTREAIRTTFSKNRWCIVMNRPASDDRLPFLSTLPDSEFSPIFLEQLQKLKNYIATHITVKTYRGQPLPGWGWCELAEKFVDAINQDRIPSIENHTTTLLRLGLERGINETKKKWKETCQSWMLSLTQDRKNCTLDSLLEWILLHLKKQMMKQYQAHLFGGETEETKQTWKHLMKEMKQDMFGFQKANLEALRMMIRTQFQSVISSFDPTNLINWEELKKQETKWFDQLCQTWKENAVTIYKMPSLPQDCGCPKTWKVWTEEREKLVSEFVQLLSVSFQQQMQTLKKQFDTVAEREQQCQQDLKLKEGAVKEKEALIHSLEVQKTEIEMVQCTQSTQKDLITGELKIANEKIRSLEQDLDRLHKDLEEKNIYHHEHEILQSEYETCRAHLAKQEEELHAIKNREEQESEHFQSELAKSQAQILSYKQKMNQLFEHVKTKEIELKRIQERLEMKQNECIEWSKKCQKVTESLEERGKQCGQAQEMLSRQLEEYKALNKEKNKLEKVNFEQQQALVTKAHVEQKLNECEIRSSSQESVIRSLQTEKGELDKLNKNLLNQNANLRDQLKQTNELHESKHKNLLKKLDKLEAEKSKHLGTNGASPSSEFDEVDAYLHSSKGKPESGAS